MNSAQRIQHIADYVRARLYETARGSTHEYIDPDYRWQHTLRVTHIGRELAAEEGADEEQVLAACLIHDMAHFDDPDNYRDHGRLAARLARPLLEELGYTPEAINIICHAVGAHVDDNAGFEHPPTLVSAIVSDADNIDRFGPLRILQFCAPELEDFPALANKVRERLITLQEYLHKQMMGTASGNRRFNAQLDRMIQFYEDLLTQYAMSELPGMEQS